MTNRFEIASTTAAVDFWVDTRLPFQPKGELVDARKSLCNAIRQLTAPPNQILSATYRTQQDAYCDVENILFYNVGTSNFGGVTQNGLRFERICAAPPPSPSGNNYAHHHRYEFVEPDFDQHADITPNYSLSCGLPPLSSSSKPHQIWWSIGKAVKVSYEPVPGPFELRIVLHHSPPGRNVANFLKAFLDGLISALHSESDFDPDAVARLTRLTGWDSDEVVTRLVSPVAPVLGPRRLLQTYREFVKWNPADHRCTGCTIITRQDSGWSCVVQVLQSSLRRISPA